MRRLVALPGTLAFAAVLWGCSGDVKEEAPGVATGEVVAQAPPNAIGADVDRPAAADPVKAHPKSPSPGITGHAGKAPSPRGGAGRSHAPAVASGGTPQKGTDL